MIDRILCSPFSRPATVNVTTHDRKANARDKFCPRAVAGVRTYTERRKQLFKNIQQARQTCRVQFPIYPNIKIC